MISSLIDHIKQKTKNIRGQDLVWYFFIVIMLAMTWSGAKAVQTNYELQKQISRLQQENDVMALQNQNIALQNKYLESDQYLDVAARESLGLASPGEHVLLVPSSVAMKYANQSVVAAVLKTNSQIKQPSRYVRNLEAWRDFLLGRQILSN